MNAIHVIEALPLTRRAYAVELAMQNAKTNEPEGSNFWLVAADVIGRDDKMANFKVARTVALKPMVTSWFANRGGDLELALYKWTGEQWEFVVQPTSVTRAREFLDEHNKDAEPAHWQLTVADDDYEIIILDLPKLGA